MFNISILNDFSEIFKVFVAYYHLWGKNHSKKMNLYAKKAHKGEVCCLFPIFVNPVTDDTS